MKPKESLVLLIIVTLYSLIHFATSYSVPCEGDCEQVGVVNAKIKNNRESYVFYAQRCSRNVVSDTICVYVKDTIGIDWNIIADSTCYFSNQAGLPRQKIFVIKGGFQTDTVARRQCP